MGNPAVSNNETTKSAGDNVDELKIKQKDDVKLQEGIDNKGFKMEKLLDNANEEKQVPKENGVVIKTSTPCNLRFGIAKWRPQCLQRFNDPKWFILCIALFSLCQAIVVNGFLVSSIASIEKEFGFSSKQSSIIMAANDVAGLLFVPVVSFFCTRQKPKWIAIGSLCCGFGALLFALPKLIVGAYEPTILGGAGSMQSMAMCRSYAFNPNSTMPTLPSCDSKAFSVETISLLIFVIAQIVMGIGATPLYTLGPAYIDENVNPQLSPIYLGIWFATTFIGPGLGLILGGSFLRIYTDIEQPKGANLTARDPRWIGAWWLSFFSLAWLLFLTAVILICYPDAIEKSKAKRDKAIRDGHLPKADKLIEQSLRGMFRATVQLLKNKTYMFTVLAFTVRTMYGVGLGSFFAKLIIIKFGLRPDRAGMVLGVILVPGMTVGIMFGAYIMKKIPLKKSAKMACLICFFCSILGMISSGSFLIPGCQDSNFAGVERPYYNSTLNGESLYSTCNRKCGCINSIFAPVCGSDGVSYYSPCHAGCSGALGPMLYANCSCIPTSGPPPTRTNGSIAMHIQSSNATTAPPANATVYNLTTSQPTTHAATTASIQQPRPSLYGGTATFGFCDRGCKNLEVFLLLMLLLLFIVFSSATPNKMIVLRVVPANQRSYALGLQFVFLRGLSFIPGPVISGSIIDGACKLWGVDECGRRTNCYDYKVDQLSSLIALFGAITAVIATIFYFLAWYFCKPEDILSDGKDLNSMEEYKKVTADDNDNTAL